MHSFDVGSDMLPLEMSILSNACLSTHIKLILSTQGLRSSIIVESEMTTTQVEMGI